MGWRDDVRRVVPYTPGEQPKEAKIIKLNTNENPYPPSPRVQEALTGSDPDLYRRYPDPTAGDLVRSIAQSVGVKPSQVFVGVGSDDVLAMSFLTFFGKEKPILFPDITYSFYDVWADLFRIPYEAKPLDDSFRIQVEDYLSQQGRIGGIIFPNPNAPTGIQMPLEKIERILDGNRDVVVIVDEAYVDFGCESALSLLPKYENLLVVQTLSKSRSLAGMRIGFAVGSEEMIGYLSDVKYAFNSYTMNRPSIVAGVAAMEDVAYFEKTRSLVMETREWAKGELASLGFSFGDSKANFIFASHATVPAKVIFEKLRERHIYVRYFARPRIDNHLRITVGTREEMEALFHALKEIVG